MVDTRLPLLYLVHRIPYPPNKGDKVRSFNILRHLAKSHRVFLGTFVDHPDDEQYVERLPEWCEGVLALRLHPLPQRLASLSGLLRGEALSLPYYRDARMQSWVEQIVAKEGIRQAVVFSGPMAQYLNGASVGRQIIDFCDMDSAKWVQYAADCRWPMSWLYRREGTRLLAFERSAAQLSNASLFVTAAEANLFVGAAPEAAPKVEVMQNGVDADFFSPEHAFESPFPAGGPVLLFTGAMDYWPNVDGVNWFVKEILPKVRALRADVRFWIVGMNPTPDVQALAGDGVFVTGTVPDVRPYLRHADVVVTPLRIARGIQNKVLEAMAMGRPVVVTAESATGLKAESGRECAIAADGDEFVKRIMELLDDDLLRCNMGKAGRDRVLASYSWAAHLSLLDKLLDAPVS